MGNARFPQVRKQSSLITGRKRDKMIMEACYKAFMLAAFGVLSDAYDWEEDKLVEFKRYMDELTRMMDDGTEDWQQMSRNIEEVVGVKIA